MFAVVSTLSSVGRGGLHGSLIRIKVKFVRQKIITFVDNRAYTIKQIYSKKAHPHNLRTLSAR